jgi:putative chitinase
MGMMPMPGKPMPGKPMMCMRTNGWSAAMRKKFGALACGDMPMDMSGKNLISNAQLQKIMPGAPAGKIDQYAPYLNQAMQKAGINTPAREAAFLAQLGHESGSFKYMQELASGKAYEGRKDLGNTQPGDGVKYKGRGPIQITGRANYAAAGKALGIDLINNPGLAATPQVGFQVAAWYWNSHNLNKYADMNNQAGFDKITRIINGGTNGAADRNARYNTAKQQLGDH